MTHFQTPIFSQKAVECFKKNRSKNDDGFMLYLNEGTPSKLINSYDVKEGSEIVGFEFSISNK